MRLWSMTCGETVTGVRPTTDRTFGIIWRTHAVAALPDGVSDAEAATLPVAGLHYPARLASSGRGSPRIWTAWTIWSGCAGRRGLTVPIVGSGSAGEWQTAGSVARSAIGARR